MAKIDIKSKENPKLCQTELSDGRISLSLEYYFGRTEKLVYDKDGNQVLYASGKMKCKPKRVIKHERKKESLNLYIWQCPRSSSERLQNKETIELANKIRWEREQEFKERGLGYRLKARDVNMYDFFKRYVDEYTKTDVRCINSSIVKFEKMIALYYPQHKVSITAKNINREMIVKYTEYLIDVSKGNGAVSMYNRFKKVIKYATEKGLFVKNPCDGVTIKCDTEVIKKAILSEDEIKTLVSCHYDRENEVLRNAFVFSLFSGVRYCDVCSITFDCIDFQNKIITFDQNKTHGHSSRSVVTIPIGNMLMKILLRQKEISKGKFVFDMPTEAMCRKFLKRWTEKAGITKHITWHCARHSFAVNILNNGANIKTVSNLLGHASLKHTEKYLRAVDALKVQAIESLPDIDL